MNSILKIVSFSGLLLTIVPSFLVFNGTISFQLHTTLMLVGMILWFASSPFWMKEKKL
ncbi:hypothetical protein [Rhodohalobacter sp. SW132]|uniref:hypothetical protein n=1 Tax=Rhodohalobacter sp. SW132 TaxID=2293433 RepID=UPI0018F58458|nr:hypothetical protein [Rhodohalobacter sp. SW132]